MRPIVIPLSALLVALAPWAPSRSLASPPRAARAVVISIDGLRPDVLMASSAPVLRELMGKSSFTLSAITTASCVTLPSHTSMLTGVPPDVHGVTWNGDQPPAGRRHP